MPNIITTGAAKSAVGAKLYGQDSSGAAGYFNPNEITETSLGRKPIGANLTKMGILFGVGEVGAFDEKKVESPSVWFDEKLQKWGMVYTGYCDDGSGNIGWGGIGLAWSYDLFTWTKDPASPIITKSDVPDTPDFGSITAPFMFYEDGTYYLYYLGNSLPGYEQGEKSLCVATSETDVYTWTRFASNPIISRNLTDVNSWYRAAVWHPNIIKTGGLYYNFFNGSDNTGRETIGYATSVDKINWTVNPDRILNTGTLEEWDNGIIGDPYVYKVGRIWYMAYFGADQNFQNLQDGMAWTTEEDFPVGWTKYSNNPVLRNTLVYERSQAGKPCIILYGGALYHYYYAYSGSFNYIALAVENPLPQQYTYEAFQLASSTLTINANGNINIPQCLFDIVGKKNIEMRILCRGMITDGQTLTITEGDLTSPAATVTLNSASWTNYKGGWTPVVDNVMHTNLISTISGGSATVSILQLEFRWNQ